MTSKEMEAKLRTLYPHAFTHKDLREGEMVMNIIANEAVIAYLHYAEIKGYRTARAGELENRSGVVDEVYGDKIEVQLRPIFVSIAEYIRINRR